MPTSMEVDAVIARIRLSVAEQADARDMIEKNGEASSRGGGITNANARSYPVFQDLTSRLWWPGSAGGLPGHEIWNPGVGANRTAVRRDEYCHVIPQYDFLHDAKGNCLVDYIGRFENLQQGMDAIRARLGLPAQPLKHRNKSLSLFNRRDIGLYHVLKTLSDSLSLRQKRNTFSHYT